MDKDIFWESMISRFVQNHHVRKKSKRKASQNYPEAFVNAVRGASVMSLSTKRSGSSCSTFSNSKKKVYQKLLFNILVRLARRVVKTSLTNEKKSIAFFTMF